MTKKLFVMLFDFNEDGSMRQVYRICMDDLETGVLLKHKGKLYVHADSTPLPNDRWTVWYVEQQGIIDLPDEETD